MTMLAQRSVLPLSTRTAEDLPQQVWSDDARAESRWPCWIEVDLDRVEQNVRAIQRLANPRRGVIAVVKAQAYGLGATAVARAALQAGAISVAVARVSEAMQLRANSVEAPILVLGALAPGEMGEVVRHHLTATVTDWTTASRLQRAAAEAGEPVGIHVKVDTGITRYGGRPEEVLEIVRRLPSLPALRLEGFYSHFAAADDPDIFFARQQLAYFQAICHQLESEGHQLGLKHLANSAGSLRLPESALDAVRVGIALSGSYATPAVPRVPGLASVVTLKARIGRLHNPPIGTSIGYGRTYKVTRPMQAALITCGYADGLPRACSNRGWVLIRGQRAPLVGTVSMDMAMADVSHIPSVQVGDEVVVLGRQGDEAITLDDIADYAGIIPHELLVRLGSRAPRLHLRRGEPAGAASLLCDREIAL